MNKAIWRILIVDDSPEDREVIQEVLLKGSLRRYRFDQADTAAECLRLLKGPENEPYDGVLMDFHLPEQDAPDVLRSLGDACNMPCPIVVLTGIADRRLGQEVIGAGAQDYLSKDCVTPEMLTRVLENAVDRHTRQIEQLRLEQALKTSEARFRSLIEFSGDAIGLLGPAGFMETNAAALRLYGCRSHEDFFGKSPRDFSPPTQPDGADSAMLIAQHLDTVFRNGSHRFEWRHCRLDGSEFDADIRLTRIDLPEGPVVQAIVRDITERKQAEAAERQSEERLRLATDGALLGIWYWDITHDTLEWSERCKTLLGFSPSQTPSLQGFYDAIYPGDKDRVAHEVQQALDSHEDFTSEYRVMGLNGAHRWIGSLGRPYYGAKGQAIGMGGVILDITARKNTEQALSELNRDLEQKVEQRTAQLQTANAAKSQFLASMSHEIRTPMNAVLGLAQLLEDEPLTEDQVQMVHRINSAGRSLLSIINDILDFSKIEAGQLSVEQRPFKLADLLGHIGHLFGSVAQGKGLTLCQRDDSSISGRLSGDALRIEQVLINLVENALKFTEQGGVTIRVQPVNVTESAARLRFEIQDTGIGMSPEAVAKLFQPFTQADTGIARRFGGTGLGLSISKRLVELMGGEIGVTSTTGVGSTFWFELPFDRLPDGEQPETSATEVKGPRLQGLRLLVVDDSQINLYLAERVLKREGAEVTLLTDGQLALDALRANPEGYDLVLMDIQMPVMDGLTATRAIRGELGLITLPVIALTAGVLAEEKQNALDAGVNDFLPKPLDLDLMATMIRSYCPTVSGKISRTCRRGG